MRFAIFDFFFKQVQVTITENQIVGHVVLASITGNDPDGDNAQIKYEILSGNALNTFAMNRNNGQITIQRRNAPNYENLDKYSLSCQGIDQNGNNTQFEIAITITDVNEAPFVLYTSYSSRIVYEIDENSISGTVVDSKFNFEINDPEDDTFTYKIVGTSINSNDPTKHYYPSGTFSLSGIYFNNGIPLLTLNTENLLDHETTPLIALHVEVIDALDHKLELTIWINVLNSNERPKFKKEMTNMIHHVNENTKKGTAIGPRLIDYIVDPDVTSIGRHRFFLHGDVGMYGSAAGKLEGKKNKKRKKLRLWA